MAYSTDTDQLLSLVLYFKKETTRAPTQDRQLSSGNPAAPPVHPPPQNSEPSPTPPKQAVVRNSKDASPLPRRDEQSRRATCSLPEQPAWCDLFFSSSFARRRPRRVALSRWSRLTGVRCEPWLPRSGRVDARVFLAFPP